jgi:hypothetical protein
MNKKLPALFGVLALGVGAAGAIALQSHAQNTPSQSVATNTPASVVGSSSTATSAVDTPESANDPADTATSKTHGHAPLGGDGVVSSINGTTIVIGEETDEGGASYTVDASRATLTSNGASAILSDIKVGDKIFVQGAVNGTNVSATSISLGHQNGDGKKGGSDTDGGAASETKEGTSTPDTSDQ